MKSIHAIASHGISTHYKQGLQLIHVHKGFVFLFSWARGVGEVSEVNAVKWLLATIVQETNLDNLFLIIQLQMEKQRV